MIPILVAFAAGLMIGGTLGFIAVAILTANTRSWD